MSSTSDLFLLARTKLYCFAQCRRCGAEEYSLAPFEETDYWVRRLARHLEESPECRGSDPNARVFVNTPPADEPKRIIDL